MILGLDTSVVVRLLVGAPPAQAKVARAVLDAATDPVFINDLVVGESFFVLRHHYAVPHAAAVAALKALLGDPHVRASRAAHAAVDQAASETPGLMDRLIHEHYADAGTITATFDRDAAKLKGARLLA